MQGATPSRRPALPEGKSWAGDITKATLPDRFVVDDVGVYDLVNRAPRAQP